MGQCANCPILGWIGYVVGFLAGMVVIVNILCFLKYKLYEIVGWKTDGLSEDAREAVKRIAEESGTSELEVTKEITKENIDKYKEWKEDQGNEDAREKSIQYTNSEGKDQKIMTESKKYLKKKIKIHQPSSGCSAWTGPRFLAKLILGNAVSGKNISNCKDELENENSEYDKELGEMGVKKKTQIETLIKSENLNTDITQFVNENKATGVSENLQIERIEKLIKCKKAMKNFYNDNGFKDKYDYDNLQRLNDNYNELNEAKKELVEHYKSSVDTRITIENTMTDVYQHIKIHATDAVNAVNQAGTKTGSENFKEAYNEQLKKQLSDDAEIEKFKEKLKEAGVEKADNITDGDIDGGLKPVD